MESYMSDPGRRRRQTVPMESELDEEEVNVGE